MLHGCAARLGGCEWPPQAAHLGELLAPIPFHSRYLLLGFSFFKKKLDIAFKGFAPRGLEKKNIFDARNGTRNRKAAEAKNRFEHPRKEK